MSLLESIGDDGAIAQVVLDEPAARPSPLPLPARRSPLARYTRIGLALAGTDITCLAAALLAAQLGGVGPADSVGSAYVAAPLVAAVLWAPIFHTFGLYSVQHLSPADEFRRTIGATSVGILLVILLSYWSKSDLSRAWVATSWVGALALELAARRVWRYAIGRMRRGGLLTMRTLIVGTNDEAEHLSGVLARRGLGFEPIGFVNTASLRRTVSDRLPIVGSLHSLRRQIEENAADCIFVASTALTSDEMLTVVTTARVAKVEVRISANLSQILAARLSVQNVANDLMAISLKPVRLTRGQELLKRTFDVLLAAAGLIIMSPVMVTACLLIKLTSRGSLLFRQRRVTKGGRVFTAYKFRTMVDGSKAARLSTDLDDTTAFFKIVDDPRLTKVGKVLRRLSIDELPQLLNVLRGDMSLVGPRPLPIEQVEAHPELLTSRLEVQAGVTGWWQVNGRSDLTAEEAVRLDLFYIENWSLSLDLFIVLKTIGIILARRGAY